jgi:hypothetical protein
VEQSAGPFFSSHATRQQSQGAGKHHASQQTKRTQVGGTTGDANGFAADFQAIRKRSSDETRPALVGKKLKAGMQ